MGHSAQVYGGKIDGLTDARVGIDYEHHEVHGGSHYTLCHYQTTTGGTTGGLAYIIRTSTNTSYAHMKFTINAALNAEYFFYEACTTSSDGSALTAYNNNRTSSNVPALIISEGASITTDGTTLKHEAIGVDGVNPVGQAGGVTDRSDEYILGANQAYGLEIFPLNNDTRWSVCFSWYEEGGA